MIEFRVGDVRKLLAELPDRSVDLIATSWPYHVQRDYLPADHPMKRYEIGQESTPAEFIQTLLDVTAGFRRVLAPHGSIATELGDGFSGSGGAGGDYNENGLREGQPKFARSMTVSRRRDREPVPLNRYGGGKNGWPLERSLVMAPELYRVALAYGIHPLTGEPSPAGRWRVRNLVVHGRPNPPVGALGDKWRPACSYWVVACTGRRWFDLDAVRGPGSPNTHARTAAGVTSRPSTGKAANDTGRSGNFSTLNVLHDTDGAPPLDWFEDEGDQFERDLWTLPTSPYPGSHYATFSPELIRRFIVSMCPQRVCRECGKPSVRLTSSSRVAPKDNRQRKVKAGEYRTNGHDHPPEIGWQMSRETLGWSDCGHDAWRPGLVLDPFGGSGTTGMVAAGNGRDCVMFDLDERCVDLARERIGLYLDELAQPQPEPPEPSPEHEQEAML